MGTVAHGGCGLRGKEVVETWGEKRGQVHIFKEAVLSVGSDGVENVYQSPFFAPCFDDFLTSLYLISTTKSTLAGLTAGVTVAMREERVVLEVTAVTSPTGRARGKIRPNPEVMTRSPGCTSASPLR